MPMSLPSFLSPSSGVNSTQVATVDFSQPNTIEQPKSVNPNSTSSPDLSLNHHLTQLTEPVVTSPRGVVHSNKPIKVYSRRPKGPAPQLSQLLEPECGPTIEENIKADCDLDMSIAIRKGVRSSVKYHISNYLT